MFKVSTLANSSIFQCLRSLHFNFSMFKVSSRSLHLQILQFFNVQGLYTCKFFNFSMFKVSTLEKFSILSIPTSLWGAYNWKLLNFDNIGGSYTIKKKKKIEGIGTFGELIMGMFPLRLEGVVGTEREEYRQ